jgi:hypothetical protein
MNSLVIITLVFADGQRFTSQLRCYRLEGWLLRHRGKHELESEAEGLRFLGYTCCLCSRRSCWRPIFQLHAREIRNGEIRTKLIYFVVTRPHSDQVAPVLWHCMKRCTMSHELEQGIYAQDWNNNERTTPSSALRY